MENPTDLQRLVAWQGTMELMNANWSLGSGQTVELRIAERSDEEGPHPFRQFQRRRGGKMGQRFHAVFVPEGAEQAIYDSEVMLAGWSESDRGRMLKLWLDEHGGQHPFSGLNARTAKEPGQLFGAVFVLITDDGQAVDQEVEDRLGGKRRKLSSDAHLIVTGPLFAQFLSERYELPARLRAQGWTADIAKRFVKHRLGIESLSDLDRNEAAATRFHEEFRKPFAATQGRD